jgi:hypothetical protein
MGYPPEPKYVQTTIGDSTSMCPHCGVGHIGTCPRIKAIEYHLDGTVKRVEFHPMPQLMQPIERKD